MPNAKIIKTTKEQVAQELISAHNKIGFINETVINNECSFSRRAIRTHFGNITNACLELNLIQQSSKPESRKNVPRKIYTKDEAISIIKNIESKHGYFSKGLINVNGPEYGAINHKVINRIWGNFANMYEELNVKQKLSTKGTKIIPDKEYASIISSYIKENNIVEFNSAVLNNICKKHFIAYDIICKRFGPSIEEVATYFNLTYTKKWQSEEFALEFVAKYLNDFDYIKQYRNKNIKNQETNTLLRIDGFWPNHNLCVEYNGQQHYKFVKHFHSKIENFEKSQQRDTLKYELIKEQDFKLIIIKYNDSEQDVLNKLNILSPSQTSN